MTRFWTEEQIEMLRARYPHEKTRELAAALGRPERSVYQKALDLGLKKTAAYLASPAACRLRQGDNIGAASRFKSGHDSWNRGLKGWQAGGRSAETQFKPGQRGSKYVPIGTERINEEGYLERKVRHSGIKAKDWDPVHRIVWEAANGPIPSGHLVVFRNGDKRDIRLDNLELISRAENMRRNTYHRYPKEIALAIQLRGALNRQINKRLGREEQN